VAAGKRRPVSATAAPLAQVGGVSHATAPSRPKTAARLVPPDTVSAVT
jgi:hypothetical protein